MLHHLDLNVADLRRSDAFYAALLGRLGYERGESGNGWTTWRFGAFYMTLVQAAPAYVGHGFHRKRIGVNHLALPAPTREAVDDLHRWLLSHGATVLYGGPKEMGDAGAPNYAVLFEDPDRLKLEYVFRPR